MNKSDRSEIISKNQPRELRVFYIYSMDKIIFNWSIPESKKDITIDTWTNWVKYTSNEEDIEIDFLQRKMYEMFCGVPMEYFNNLKQSEINEIEYNLGQVFESKSKLITRFEFKGVKYGLIPNFREDITAGELIDLDKYLLEKDYVRLMSILYRPIKESTGSLYKIEPYFGTHTDFSELDYEKLDGVLSFFLLLYQKLAHNTLKYSLKIVQETPIQGLDAQEKTNLLKNGEDILKSFGY